MTDTKPAIMYEDELPKMTDAQYEAWYARSWVDGVRAGPAVNERGDIVSTTQDAG